MALAACLVRRPDLLLLDEPEAHLDIRRRTRLEELLADLPGAVVMVSHDRYLLDETVGEIAELEHGRVRIWPGNYSAFAIERELELVRRRQDYVTQQKEIARLEESIRRFKDWANRVPNERHIKQANNKQRQIDRMEKVDRPVLERRRMALRLRGAARGGERVVELRDVEFDPVLTGVDLTVMRGERIGVIGPNGAGKTVLLRLLCDELKPTGGERWAGPAITFDHLTQTASELPGDATALELVRATRSMPEDDAVRHLMAFLFDYEQVRRPVGTMSGGERTRLRCLQLMLAGANCLILDEPTNHLDIDAVEVLEGALEAFAGTVIAVSHDRYFLDRIADRIVEVADLEVHAYEGGLQRLGAERPPRQGSDVREHIGDRSAQPRVSASTAAGSGGRAGACAAETASDDAFARTPRSTIISNATCARPGVPTTTPRRAGGRRGCGGAPAVRPAGELPPPPPVSHAGRPYAPADQATEIAPNTAAADSATQPR